MKLHLCIYCGIIWHFKSKGRFGDVCVWHHRVCHLQSFYIYVKEFCQQRVSPVVSWFDVMMSVYAQFSGFRSGCCWNDGLMGFYAVYCDAFVLSFWRCILPLSSRWLNLVQVAALPWRRGQHILSKCWIRPVNLHSVETQKTMLLAYAHLIVQLTFSEGNECCVRNEGRTT
jgi:hypothetical protein